MERTYQLYDEEMQDENQFYEVHFSGTSWKGLVGSVLEYGCYIIHFW
jgi:hypothetical protein